MNILLLGIFTLVILILYVAGILIYTPFEEDDKYLLKILRFAFRIYDRTFNGISLFKWFGRVLTKGILYIGYVILRVRGKLGKDESQRYQNN